MIWKSKRNRDRQKKSSAEAVKRRTCTPERLEARRLLAADAIHVGVVYIETDYLESDQDVGSDSQGDRFILSFTGGAPETELSELRIRTDKDGDGITVGDPIYDTAEGGRGKRGAHGFEVIRTLTSGGRQVDAFAEVEDGGQELILKLANFRSGDRLEFTLDVDEVLRNAIDLAVFNDRLDVITSGQEFQDSILEATFDAPHYESSVADAIFLNDYGTPSDSHGLDLPPDEGDDPQSRPNRSAAAVASVTQTPKPVEISGHVWVDNDLDAVREDGEAPIELATVALWRFDPLSEQYADTGFRATTGADGRYHFPKTLGIQPGTYRVVESQPEGFYSVAAVPGTVALPTSVGLPTSVALPGKVAGDPSGRAETADSITDITIPLGDMSAVDQDFAEAQPASLSGFVYQDNNDDGIRQPGEPGSAGVRVSVVAIDSIAAQETLTVTTDADGAYRFDDLAPGRYDVIEVDQPAGLLDGKDTVGTVAKNFVGVASSNDQIREIDLFGGDQGIEYNFGELPLGSLGGFVYLAAPGTDCHGSIGNGELPLPGVNLSLQSENGDVIANTTTGSDGSYQFVDLTPGNYQILQLTPNGLFDGGSSPGRINDVVVGESVDGGLIRNITLTSGHNGIAYNFCEAGPASISGYVYHDQSDDGVRDSTESGIAGVELSLIDDTGQVVATTSTEADGKYRFSGLPAGIYSLAESQPASYLDGVVSVGSVRGQANGFSDFAPDWIGEIDLRQGDEGVEYNFGELLPATISGQVHLDLDGDCVLDEDESGLEGVLMSLIDERGDLIATTTTDVTGKYRFEGLLPGTYSVLQQQPEGVFNGAATPGTHGGIASGSDRIGQITLASGEVAVDYDFCERPGAEISGVVFADQDGDCIQDPGESGIARVTIELYDNAGQLVATTQTDADGRYRFSHLAAGEYTLVETQPIGWLQGGQMAGSHGGDDSQVDTIAAIPVDFGQRITQYNFCEVEPASISGAVFVDDDGDCIQDATESAVPGVTIELRDADGNRIATTTTDADGRYQFANLPPGQYQVFELQPNDLFDGDESAGTGNGLVLANDLIGVDLMAGQTLVDYNFCELAPASISGQVWHDADGNDLFDPSESSLAGVLVELVDSSGTVVGESTTDSSGRYRFVGIAPGVYDIRETQPSGYFHGGQVVGNAGGSVDGDDTLIDIPVRSGQHASGYNFPEIAPAQISGRVFQDGDAIEAVDPPEPSQLRDFVDGVFTEDDIPIAGVTVELRDASGDAVDGRDMLPGTHGDGPIRAITGEDGSFSFSGLRPGVYHLYQVHPDGFVDGLDTPGSTGGVAVNAPDAYSIAEQEKISSLKSEEATDPKRDAILNVVVQSGGISTRNDFSEILVVPPSVVVIPGGIVNPNPPQAPAVQPAIGIVESRVDVLTPPFVAPPPLRLVNYAAPPIGIRPPLVAIEEWEVTWHLSVINGGYPRGLHGSQNVIRNVSAKTASDWDSETNDRGRWTIVGLDGKPVERATRMSFGANDGTALTGDFDGDGFDEAAIFVAGQWYVDLNGNGRWDKGDLWIRLGTTLDRPVVGDWDGDGKDDIAIFGLQWQNDPQRIPRDPGLPDPENMRRRVFDARQVALRENVETIKDRKRLLRRGDDGDLRADAVDHVFQYGEQVDAPLAGDWNGDGIDQIAIFRGGQWILDSDGDGRWTEHDAMADFGKTGDQPIVGDFNGDQIDEIAVVRGDLWIIDTDGDRRLTGNDLQIEIPRHSGSSQPIVGDFNGDGKDEPGYYDEAG